MWSQYPRVTIMNSILDSFVRISLVPPTKKRIAPNLTTRTLNVRKPWTLPVELGSSNETRRRGEKREKSKDKRGRVSLSDAEAPLRVDNHALGWAKSKEPSSRVAERRGKAWKRGSCLINRHSGGNAPRNRAPSRSDRMYHFVFRSPRVFHTGGVTSTPSLQLGQLK